MNKNIINKKFEPINAGEYIEKFRQAREYMGLYSRNRLEKSKFKNMSDKDVYELELSKGYDEFHRGIIAWFEGDKPTSTGYISNWDIGVPYNKIKKAELDNIMDMVVGICENCLKFHLPASRQFFPKDRFIDDTNLSVTELKKNWNMKSFNQNKAIYMITGMDDRKHIVDIVLGFFNKECNSCISVLIIISSEEDEK